MNDLKYEPVLPVTREKLDVLLKSEFPEIVASALYAATKYIEDWNWVEDQCTEAVKSSDIRVRWAAATCLGDLALLRRPLNLATVVPALLQLEHGEAVLDRPRVVRRSSGSDRGYGRFRTG